MPTIKSDAKKAPAQAGTYEKNGKTLTVLTAAAASALVADGWTLKKSETAKK